MILNMNLHPHFYRLNISYSLFLTCVFCGQIIFCFNFFKLWFVFSFEEHLFHLYSTLGICNSPQLITICLMIIWIYYSTEKSGLWLILALMTVATSLWTHDILGTWHPACTVFMTVTVSWGHRVALCNLPKGLLTNDVNRERWIYSRVVRFAWWPPWFT